VATELGFIKGADEPYAPKDQSEDDILRKFSKDPTKTL
jgi:hypothetical protein